MLNIIYIYYINILNSENYSNFILDTNYITVLYTTDSLISI